MTRPWGRIAALVIVLTSAAGCVQVPQPITVTSAPIAPAWTTQQAQQERARITAAYDRAVRTRTEAPALDTLDGIERSVAAGAFSLRERFGSSVERDTWRTGSIVASWASAKTSYPQTGFVVIKLRKKLDGAGQVLEVYTRARAAQRWKRSASVLIEKSITWPKSGSLITPAPAQVNGIDTSQAQQFLQAMNTSTASSDARFVRNESFLMRRRLLASIRKAEGTSRASARFAVVDDTASFTTGSISWLVVPCHLSFVQTLKSGWTYRVGKKLRKQFPGEYGTSSDSYALTYLLRVPRTGKIEIAGSRANWIDTSYS